MGLNIAVLGTSNSILKGGYTYGIKDHPGVGRLDNWSLGASTTVVLPKVSVERSFELHDYVIFDFVVNEEQLLPTNVISIEDIRDRLVQFISAKVNSPGTIPVIVVLPLEWSGNIPKPVAQFYKDFARERGYPFFCGYEYVAEIRCRIGRTHRLFQDAAHLLPEIAYGFGTLIAEGLIYTKKSEHSYRNRQEVTTLYEYHRICPSHDEITTQPIRRKSSISEGVFYEVTPDAKVTVRLREESRLCGLELNNAQTNANIVVETGRSKVIGALNNRHYVGDGVKFIHVVVPVEPIAGQNFTIAAEDGRHPAPRLEVSGFVFSGKQEAMTSPVWTCAEEAFESRTLDAVITAATRYVTRQV